MMGYKAGRVVVAVLMGITVLAISSMLSMLFRGIWTQVVVHTSMLLLSLLAIWILGRGRFYEYGFRPARKVRWVRLIAIALALGVLNSLTGVLLGGGGVSLVQDLSFGQIALLVWLFASVAEEILTRGLIQGYLAPLSQDYLKLGRFRLNVPTLVGALFFGAMHLALLTTGTDVRSTLVVVVYAFFLGLLAGHSRAQAGSLIPAVVVHILGNVGGVLGEMLGAMTMGL
jgi:membrane protease YdiL (CAAX protease family)